jgi:hypothetical protein
MLCTYEPIVNMCSSIFNVHLADEDTMYFSTQSTAPLILSATTSMSMCLLLPNHSINIPKKTFPPSSPTVPSATTVRTNHHNDSLENSTINAYPVILSTTCRRASTPLHRCSSQARKENPEMSDGRRAHHARIASIKAGRILSLIVGLGADDEEGASRTAAKRRRVY